MTITDFEPGEAFISPEQMMMRRHGNACSRAHPPDVLKPVSLVSSAFCTQTNKKRVLGLGSIPHMLY